MARINPDIKAPNVQGSQLYSRPEIKARVAELKQAIEDQLVMAIGEKRDQLRRMILGELPTKVIKKADGTVDAIFDRLAALTTDAKLGGEFAPEKQEITMGPVLKLDFRTFGRNTEHPILDAEWKRLNAPALPEPGDSSKEQDGTTWEQGTDSSKEQEGTTWEQGTTTISIDPAEGPAFDDQYYANMEIDVKNAQDLNKVASNVVDLPEDANPLSTEE